MVYKDNTWVPDLLGQVIKTEYNTIKVISVHGEQIYNVEIAGEHGIHKAKMTEHFLKDIGKQ